MSNNVYYLFVDEVKPTPPFTVYNYTGLVIKKYIYENKIINSINQLKDNTISSLGGKNVNLHFNDLRLRKKRLIK